MVSLAHVVVAQLVERRRNSARKVSAFAANPLALSIFSPSTGAIAQLVERFVRNEEVSGSIPLSSTHAQISFAAKKHIAHGSIHSARNRSYSLCGS